MSVKLIHGPVTPGIGNICNSRWAGLEFGRSLLILRTVCGPSWSIIVE